MLWICGILWIIQIKGNVKNNSSKYVKIHNLLKINLNECFRCANCFKEAQFYCCWNTSYCDFPCQRNHWPSHMSKCTQNITNIQGSPAGKSTTIKPLYQSTPQQIGVRKRLCSCQTLQDLNINSFNFFLESNRWIITIITNHYYAPKNTRKYLLYSLHGSKLQVLHFFLVFSVININTLFNRVIFEC